MQNAVDTYFGHTHRPRLPHVSIDELEVKTVREMKLHGVMIDHKLRFVKHAKSVRCNVNDKLNVVRALNGRFFEASSCTLTKIARLGRAYSTNWSYGAGTT